MANESTPLTGSGSGGRPLRSGRTGASNRCSIITLFILSAALIALTITFNLKLRSLSTQLSTEQSNLSQLQTKVQDQQSVIDRFSNAVSNKDVLQKVSDLEDELQKTEKDLSHKLIATQQSIEDLLNATLTKLDTTVKMAQDEIQEEVDKVKHDVNDYVIQTQDQFSMENSFMVYQLAGTFTLLACLISMWHMTAHLRRFNQPFVQRKILAILWMSPVYGVTSWLSLVFPAYEGYLAVIKDFYEAYVIYQFLSLLIAILGKGDRNAVVDLLARHADHLKPPFKIFGCCCPDAYESDRSMADAVLLQCQTFTMQFVFFRPLTTIGIFICNKLEYYGWGTSGTDYRSPQFWLVMIQNLSVFIAFSGLLKFYHAVQEDLAWCRPFPKFLCIKGIVFMTFWQGLAIAILANTIGDSTPNVGNEDPELWAKQAQNFLVCLEMLLFSIAHFYCFPTEEWEDGYRPVVSDSKFGDQLALHDFFQDLKLVARQGKKKSKKKKSSDKQGDVKQPPTDDDDAAAAAAAAAGNGVASSEVGSEGGLANESFDEDELNLAQVESQISGNLASPDTPDNIRQASLRLLQAMAFESQSAIDNPPASPFLTSPVDSPLNSPARTQRLAGCDEESGVEDSLDNDDIDNPPARQFVASVNNSPGQEQRLKGDDEERGVKSPPENGDEEKVESAQGTGNESNQPLVAAAPASPQLSEIDEEHHAVEEEADEENNLMINYDDEPNEETGLVETSRNASLMFGDEGNEDDGGGNNVVMGGGPDETDGDGVLRNSLFTRLGKFST